MAGVIIFLDKSIIPDNTTEIHFFEDDRELVRFSGANLHRRHVARQVMPKAWHRTPPPATQAMLQIARDAMRTAGVLHVSAGEIEAFLAEWPEPAMPPAPEQLSPFSTMKCNICGEDVLFNSEARLFHVGRIGNHDAELSRSDISKIMRTLIEKLN